MTVIGVRYCDHCRESTPASDGTNRCLRCGRPCAGPLVGAPAVPAVPAAANGNGGAATDSAFGLCDSCRWPAVCVGDQTCWRAVRDQRAAERNGRDLLDQMDAGELVAHAETLIGTSTPVPRTSSDVEPEPDELEALQEVEISAGDAGCDADAPASPATGDVSPASPTPAEETGPARHQGDLSYGGVAGGASTTPEADGTVFDVGDVTGQPAPARRRAHYSAATLDARRAQVIADIQALAEKLGRQPTRRDDESLYGRARSAFPSWADAVEEAGYERPRRGGFKAKPFAAPADPPPGPAPAPRVMPDTPSLHDLERLALDAELTYHLVRAHYLRERIRQHGDAA